MTSQSPRIPAPPASDAASVPRRGRPSRRAPILAAALRLFRERGFHATSINDIGEAAGVAGTALYAHFATKQDLPADAIREGARRIRAGVRDALADDGLAPDAALERLVRAYVRVVLENADMYACYLLESRNLEPDVREPLLRGERGLREAWRAQLMVARPELGLEQARTMVQMAVFSLVALCLHRSRLEREELAALAETQVLGALWSPVPAPAA